MGAASRPTTFFAVFCFLAAAVGVFDSTQVAVSAKTASQKLDPVLQKRASLLTGESRVILQAGGVDASSVEPIVKKAGGKLGRRLSGIDSHVAIVPNAALMTQGGEAPGGAQGGQAPQPEQAPQPQP